MTPGDKVTIAHTQEKIQPPLPFEPQPATRKSRKHNGHRNTIASALSFDEVKTHRNRAFLITLELLTEFNVEAPELCLTAREMLRQLKARKLVNVNAERNYISPRLTELLDLGCVENPTVIEQGAQVVFIKRVPGDAVASVWRITTKGRELLACLNILHGEVKL